MPQPKSSGSSGRKGSGSSSRASSTKRGSSSSRSPARSSGGGSGAASGDKGSSRRSPGADAPEGAAASTDEAQTALSAVRERLSRGVVLTGDRLQEAVDDAVRRGRMTREDAEDLVQKLVASGRKQTDDLLAELEDLLGRGRDTIERGAGSTRKRTRSRVESVAGAARRAPGSDRVLREVDRARRVTGLGASFPISDYDELTAAQVTERLDDLSAAELRKVRDHERRNANRKTVLNAVERKLD